jgi:hypothetical protein
VYDEFDKRRGGGVEAVKKKRLSRKYFKEQGKKGGLKAWADLSAAERSKVLSRRAKKAWKTRRAKAVRAS